MTKLIFCLMGPTASGKTALATELVARFPFEIISVDSAMIYREMNIGTAKPTPEELRITPHHLLDIINPNESYSAAQFCTDAKNLSEDIFARGKIPLLVGGTMMYFNALQQGLSELPEANETLRQELETKARTLGLGALHEQLKQIDPVAAERIHAHDAQRIQRALEVYYASGTPLTELIAQKKKSSNYEFINLALFPDDRAWLHERIAQRFKHMLSEGFVAEVEALQEKWGLHLGLPSLRCVGYRQVFEFLNGEGDYKSMQEKGIAATRQLAKRQLTWLRHWENAVNFDPKNASFTAKIVAKTQEILDNDAT